MADSARVLMNKLNTLEQQILNDKNALFQFELTVQDFNALPPEASKTMPDIHTHFLNQKKGAELEITKLRHRLAQREPLYEKLKAEHEGQKAAEAKL